jgi:tetratricopeptide (TPR) repeat protein
MASKRQHRKPTNWEEEQQKPEDYFPYYQQGLHWSKYRECDRAIERFTEVIRIKPDFAQAYFERAFMYYYRWNLQNGAESDLDLAANDLDQEIRLDPLYLYAYYDRVTVNSQRKKYIEVIADCTKILQLQPDTNDGSPRYL